MFEGVGRETRQSFGKKMPSLNVEETILNQRYSMLALGYKKVNNKLGPFSSIPYLYFLYSNGATFGNVIKPMVCVNFRMYTP